MKGRTLSRLSEASGGDVAAAAAADVAAVFAAAAVAYKDAAAAAVDVVALNGEAVGPLPHQGRPREPHAMQGAWVMPRVRCEAQGRQTTTAEINKHHNPSVL